MLVICWPWVGGATGARAAADPERGGDGDADRDHRRGCDRQHRRGASDEGGSRRHPDRSVARPRRGHEAKRPQALRDVRRARGARPGAPHPRDPERRGAVRRGVRRREVVRHRVGVPPRPGVPEASRRRPRRFSERHQRWAGGQPGRPRALARLRHHHRRRHVRAGPRHAHRFGGRRLQDRRARRWGHPASARAGPDVERRGAGSGHDQPVGRALVQAHRQLHGQPARRPERVRLRRGEERAGAAAHRHPHRRRGHQGGPRIGPRGGADLRHRASAVRRRRRGARFRPRRGRPQPRAPSISPAAGRPCSRT